MSTSSQTPGIRERAKEIGVQWGLPVLAIVLWWTFSADSVNFYFPPLQTILAVLWRDLVSGPLLPYMAFSLSNMAVGLAAATILGILIGLIVGEYQGLREAATPTLNFLRSVPPAAIVPIVIIAMGIGAAPKIFIIALTCFWPILLNTIDGVRSMPSELRDTARAFGVPRGLYFQRVLLMAAMPQIMAGIRVAIAVALVLMVISEFFGASSGLGFYINDNKQKFSMPETWAGTLLIGVLGFVLSAVFMAFERWALAWYFQSERASN